MNTDASRIAAPELIEQLDATDCAANGNSYALATPNPGLNTAFTRLDSHLQGISALADLLRCHDTTRALGHPALNEYHAGGLHAALCELGFNAVLLMETVHEILTQEKAK